MGVRVANTHPGGSSASSVVSEPVERDSLYQTVRTFEGYVPKPQPAPVRPEGPAPQGALFQIEHRARAAAKRKQPATTVVDGAE